jgi:hypothetical protein
MVHLCFWKKVGGDASLALPKFQRLKVVEKSSRGV